MAGLTDLAEQKALEQLLRGVTYTPPTNIYCGPLATLPNTDNGGGGVEMTGAGASRKAVAFGPYADRMIVSTSSLSWLAGSNWGAVPGFGLWDAATGGNLLAVQEISASLTVSNGNTIFFDVGQVRIKVNKWGPFLAKAVLELLFKATAKSQITFYAHLCATCPNDDGGGAVVITGTGYTPKSVPAWAAYSGGKCNLAADLSFTSAAGSEWGPVAGVMWRDNVSPTLGNFLGQSAMSPVPTIGNGKPVVLSASGTSFGLD